MATSDELRQAVVDVLLGIDGLGGSVPDPNERNIHKYWFESDNVTDAKEYWETTDEDGEPVINGAMLTRRRRQDEELVDGKEFAKINSFRLLFRFGKRSDPLAEQKFEEFVDAILDAMLGNPDVFRVEGLHPQEADRKQVAVASLSNKKLFETRIWEAEIDFDLVNFP